MESRTCGSRTSWARRRRMRWSRSSHNARTRQPRCSSARPSPTRAVRGASPLAPLTDGSYTVTAAASDGPGRTGPTVSLLPTAGAGPLVIDTVGPRITGVVFRPNLRRFRISFLDDRGGLDPARLIDPSHYAVTRPFSRRGARLLTTSVTTVPTAPPSVAILLDNGAESRHGRFQLVVRSGGIEDVAGNALDGEFLGTFPSGDGRPGGDFVARVDVTGRHASRPRPVNPRRVIPPRSRPS